MVWRARGKTREKLAPSCVTHFSLSCLLWTRLSLSASLPSFPFRTRPCIAITQDNVSKKEGEGGGHLSKLVLLQIYWPACRAKRNGFPDHWAPSRRPPDQRKAAYLLPPLPPFLNCVLRSIHFPLQPSSLFVRDAINLYPESCRSSLKGWRGKSVLRERESEGEP